MLEIVLFVLNLSCRFGQIQKMSQFSSVSNKVSQRNQNKIALVKVSVIGGHSMTTWTQFCPFLTTNVDKNGDFLDHLSPLFVTVVIECPLAIEEEIYKMFNAKHPKVARIWDLQ